MYLVSRNVKVLNSAQQQQSVWKYGTEVMLYVFRLHTAIASKFACVVFKSLNSMEFLSDCYSLSGDASLRGSRPF